MLLLCFLTGFLLTYKRHFAPETVLPLTYVTLKPTRPGTVIELLDESRQLAISSQRMRARNSFQQWLHEKQFNNSNAAGIAFTDDDASAGFGSRMLRIVSAFVTALHLNKTLTFPARGQWTYSTCDSRNNDCYFLPISYNFNSSLDSSSHKTRNRGSVVSQLLANRTYDLWTKASLNSFYKHYNVGADWIKSFDFELPPHLGGCWVIGQLLYYLLQPNKSVERVLNAEKHRIGWGRHAVAAFHVRHGDRSQRGHQGSKLQLASFIAQLSVLDSTVKDVLLMTEDGHVVNEAKQIYTGFNFHVTEIQPRLNDDINRLLAEGVLDPEKEMHNALVNLYLAIDCDYFIGHLSSTWGRLVLLLSYGKYGCIPPRDLMGSTWKSRWGFSSCTASDFSREASLNTCKIKKNANK